MWERVVDLSCRDPLKAGGAFTAAVQLLKWSPLEITTTLSHICEKQARNSATNNSGCSKAAKWPPLLGSFQ